jgi:hypothetical protein
LLHRSTAAWFLLLVHRSASPDDKRTLVVRLPLADDDTARAGVSAYNEHIAPEVVAREVVAREVVAQEVVAQEVVARENGLAPGGNPVGTPAKVQGKYAVGDAARKRGAP